MEQFLARIWENLVDRTEGPLKFRFVLQPLVACILAIRAGLRDCREGKSAFLWSLVFHPVHRRELLRELWRDVGRVLVTALLIDVVYQLWILRMVYPGEAVLVAITLAIVPYIVVRGPITRLIRIFASSRRPSLKESEDKTCP
jgi:hypothetical protein